MSRFVLTAQLQLQAPTNTAQVVRQIQSQLNNVQVNVQVQGTAQATRQVQQVAQSLNAANTAASNLGRTFAISVRRFTALAVATRAVSLFTNTLAKATEEAIQFERELIRISQVTGKTVSNLRDLTNTITDLSTGLGVSSSSLIKISTILSQAGFDAKQTEIALKTLARTELAPTFEDITETAEGVVAIFNQFKQGAEALEGQLGAINAVAGKFAVEAGDLIGAVRRVGGVFRASGGDLNELIALFTSVRATTRESAESIATGLRTIFTRIQRPKTIEFLKQFGVELLDLEGKFVGPFEAVKRLSEALTGLGQGDVTFIRIAEELGGFRQIGKVLPLLQEFKTAQQALNVAQNAGTSLADDAAKAQASLAIRITKVKEEFLALVRGITETSSFQLFANTTLNLASALIKLADALKPIIPLLTAVATIKLAQGLSGFLTGFRGGIGSSRTFNQGGKVLKFARGGMVPGSGNRDTVPAMLQPGEFVIRKSSVNKLGVNNLAAMNENKYAIGGEVAVGAAILRGRQSSELNIPYNNIINSKAAQIPEIKQAIESIIPPNKNFKLIKDPLNKEDFPLFNEAINKGLAQSVNSANQVLSKTLNVPTPAVNQSSLQNFIKSLNDAARGNLFETILTSMVNQGKWESNPDPQQPFDFYGGLKLAAPSEAGPRLLFPNVGNLNYVDAKASMDAANPTNMANKIANQIYRESKGIENSRKLTLSRQEILSKAKEIDISSLNEGDRNLVKRTIQEKIIPTGGGGIKRLRELLQKKHFGGIIQKFAKGGKALIQKGQQLGSVGIFDSDKIPGGTNVKKALLEQIKASKKPYQVISGPAGSGKTTFAASKFGNNFILSAADLAKYSRFVVLSGAGKTKIGDLSEDVQSLLSGASGITLLSPDQERLMKQRQGRLDSAMSGNLPDERSVGALQGTLKAPTDSNEELFRRYANVEVLQQYASGGGVGTDTVPALLTPGEFVINKKSAQTIGYGSLNRMNKVGKYATGGTVGAFGPKKFNAGGPASGGGNIFGGFGVQLTLVTSALQAMIPPAEENVSALQKISSGFLTLATQVGSVIFALETFGISLNAKNIAQLFGTGPQSLGGLMKNAFSGFKMGASGMAGPMPLGGGIASRVGQIFGSTKEKYTSGINKLQSVTGLDKLQNTISSSFKYGIQEKASPLSQTGAFARVSEGLGGAGRFRQSVGDISARTGSTYGRASNYIGDTLGRFTKGAKLGSTGKFSLQNIISGQGGNAGIAGRLGGIVGKGGNLLGKIPGVGAASKFATGAIARAGAGGIGGLVGGAASLAGPIAAITGVVATINSVVGNFRDLDGQLKAAIKAEDLAKSQSLAVSKANAESLPVIGNLIGGFADLVGGADYLAAGLNAIGLGQSADQIKTSIATQIQANKAQKALTKASEESAKALQDFQNGTISAIDVLKSTSGATREAGELRKRTQEQVAANEAQKSTGGSALARNIFGLGGLLAETSTQRNNRIDKENKELSEQGKKAEEDAFKASQPGLQVLQREVAATGGSFEDFIARVKEADPALADYIQRQGANTLGLTQSFENLEKEAERTRKAFDAMNLGFQKVSAVSGALSVGLENYLSSQEAGNIGVENNIRTLQASITNAAQGISDADFKAALGGASNGLRELGATENQIKKFEENLGAVNTAQKFYAQASEQVKNKLIADFSAGRGADLSAEGQKGSFAKALTDQLVGVDDETKKRISDAIAGADISGDDLAQIASGNLSTLDKVLKDLGETTLNQVIGPLQELAKYQKILVDLTKKRIDAENNVIAAQRGVLDAQLEAQEIISKYGGPALTPQIRTQNAIAQANIQAQTTGVSRLRTGSAAELNQRSAQIRGRLEQIGNIRTASAAGNKAAQQRLQGEGGAQLEAEQKRLQELAKSDYETTKLLIKNKEEELKLIKEKNALEKSSIDALVSGDIDKFFEQQAASGAQAAIALGSDRLQGAFGASALGAAAQDIRRQQEAGQQTLFGQQLAGPGGLTERAFGAAIGARGITDPRLAQIAAGTTTEESNIESQIRDLAATLPNYAQTQLESSQQELAAAQQQFQAAEMQLEAAKANVEARSAGTTVSAMAKGGVVYANRGIFVPRGTDTVPAMLTPGEFVVRREAVQRGNNLQMLQAMNRGSSSGQTSIGGSIGMANGGIVRYRQNGSTGPENSGLGINPEVVNRLAQSLDKFNTDLSKNIDKLNSTNFSIKLDTTNVNVNLTGGSFLSKMKDELRTELMKEISTKIQNYKAGDGGNLKENRTVLG